MAVKRTHKSKTLPKVMLSILKKSRCNKWIYVVTELLQKFSVICGK